MITMQSTANPYYLHTEQTRVYEIWKDATLIGKTVHFYRVSFSYKSRDYMVYVTKRLYKGRVTGLLPPNLNKLIVFLMKSTYLRVDWRSQSVVCMTN